MAEQSDRRQLVCDWLTANGVDPKRVPRDSDLYVETDDSGAQTLHFEQYDVDDNGHRVLNQQGDGVAIRDAAVPLLVEPPEWWQPHRKPTREQLLDQLRAVYRERAHLVGLLTTLHPSHLEPDAEWPVVFVNLPTGQATWHIAKADLDLFTHVRTDLVEDWDGHTTEEKYARIRQYTALRAAR